MTNLVKALRILNVTPDDDAETIRKAWRALVRTYRPDTARRDPLMASKKLADINTAFEAVCAAESGALEKLRADIAERAEMEERQRRRARMRRKAMQTSRSAAPVFDQKVPKRDPSNVQPKMATGGTGAAAMVELAEKGFLEAMDVCSRLNFADVRSSYM